MTEYSIALIYLLVALFSSQDKEVSSEKISIMTWNVRGYPEKQNDRKKLFNKTIKDENSDILCIQEIANKDCINKFKTEFPSYTKSAFVDSKDGQDNAIFLKNHIDLLDIKDPEGFQHPAQAVFIKYKGFDATILTLHLSWSDKAIRKAEIEILKVIVPKYLKIDPDILIIGDFNLKESDIEELAKSLKLKVVLPLNQEGMGTTHAGNRYDHFLISQDCFDEEFQSVNILTFNNKDLPIAKKVSDHLPLIAMFNVNIKFKDQK